MCDDHSFIIFFASDFDLLGEKQLQIANIATVIIDGGATDLNTPRVGIPEKFQGISFGSQTLVDK